MDGLQLLREYISLVNERVRSHSFDLKALKMLKSLDAVQQYAFDTLEEIGLGSSRAAYVLSSRFALKIAHGRKGISQNEAEFEASGTSALHGLAVPVIAHHPKFWWLMTELVKPISSEAGFKQATGIDFKTFEQEVTRGHGTSLFTKRVVAAIKAAHLVASDIARFENWGTTSSGNVVILDTGFTQSVKDVAYAS